MRTAAATLAANTGAVSWPSSPSRSAMTVARGVLDFVGGAEERVKQRGARRDKQQRARVVAARLGELPPDRLDNGFGQ